jgi:hypothetical protein
MSTIASLRFEHLPKKNSPSCEDLIDFLDDLDDVGIDIGIGIGKFSRFTVHTDSLELSQHLPEDFDYADDASIAQLQQLQSQVGPWFEISEGLEVIQAITKEISKRYRSDDYATRALEDLVEIAVPTLKKFKAALSRNAEKASQFRIEMC